MKLPWCLWTRSTRAGDCVLCGGCPTWRSDVHRPSAGPWGLGGLRGAAQATQRVRSCTSFCISPFAWSRLGLLSGFSPVPRPWLH